MNCCRTSTRRRGMRRVRVEMRDSVVYLELIGSTLAWTAVLLNNDRARPARDCRHTPNLTIALFFSLCVRPATLTEQARSSPPRPPRVPTTTGPASPAPTATHRPSPAPPAQGPPARHPPGHRGPFPWREGAHTGGGHGPRARRSGGRRPTASSTSTPGGGPRRSAEVTCAFPSARCRTYLSLYLQEW